MKAESETLGDNTPKHYFSASTGGFYHSLIHARPGQPSKIPDDAVEITHEEHARLLAEHYKGETELCADKNGHPVLKSRPALSDADLLQRLRTKRDRLLKESDWTQFQDSPLDEKKRGAWRAYRQALRDLPKSAKSPAAIKFPDAPA